AAGTGAVVDHDRLAKRLRQPLADETAEHIRAAAGRVRHHQCDRAVGIGLRRRRGARRGAWVRRGAGARTYRGAAQAARFARPRGARRGAWFRRVSGARTYRVDALAARFARQRGAREDDKGSESEPELHSDSFFAPRTCDLTTHRLASVLRHVWKS